MNTFQFFLDSWTTREPNIPSQGLFGSLKNCRGAVIFKNAKYGQLGKSVHSMQQSDGMQMESSQFFFNARLIQGSNIPQTDALEILKNFAGR